MHLGKKLKAQMKKSDLFFALCNILQDYHVSFIDGADLEITSSDLTKIISTITAHEIKYESISPDKLRISAVQFDFKLFFDEEDFRSKVNLQVFENDFAILRSNEKLGIFYNAVEKFTLINNQQKEDVLIINNSYYYLLVRDFIKEKERDNFCDYFNPIKREIIFTSPKYGKLTVGYNQAILEFEIDIKQRCQKFIDSFEKKDFQNFIKNELFSYLDKYQKNDRYYQFLILLEQILDSAERNYDIYLGEFSYEDLKNKFDEKKEQYYDSIRNIIVKLTNSVLGLPLSLSAASFAAYKAMDSTPTFVMIVFAFFIYSIYQVYLIRYLKYDLELSEQKIRQDLTKIFSNPFFTKHKVEYADVKKNEKELIKRIRFGFMALMIFFSLLLLINIAFIVVMLNLMKYGYPTILAVSLTTLILSIFVMLYEPKDNAGK